MAYEFVNCQLSAIKFYNAMLFKEKGYAFLNELSIVKCHPSMMDMN